MEIEIPYTSPVNPKRYGFLTTTLLLTGLVFMALFFTRAVAPKKNALVELALALISAMLLGFGTLFLLLWADLYV
ncbi:transmembrane protein 258 [Plasmopara halstedii]|uniref:Dolichyl-diphosphooligosaccharide-protein glycosyltransferase subunit OST5 n=1 Tax=Plasmopara halstedii TaxID=4781 RepID=A0A0P1AA54_PLAHL|nr:transmembrane protein 258 [Plasmopara halstedii]CEG37002.1 transmembrane protein 258 [Plasmopara halstedii]|eukprot:XP_024573371.1 transmembrane protein 258 [Plasmopara halstedii]